MPKCTYPLFALGLDPVQKSICEWNGLAVWARATAIADGDGDQRRRSIDVYFTFEFIYATECGCDSRPDGNLASYT